MLQESRWGARRSNPLTTLPALVFSFASASRVPLQLPLARERERERNALPRDRRVVDREFANWSKRA
jgi:hypothetical protein